jgi:hypothetical protein
MTLIKTEKEVIMTSDRSANESEVGFPMAVGDSYSVHQQYGVGERRVVNDWKAVVEAFEGVDTDFGKLKAYRIKLRGFFESSSTNGGRCYLKANKTIWFAPEAKREVEIIY